MKLDGFGIFVNDMGTMIRFYRDVLGFEIKENEDALIYANYLYFKQRVAEGTLTPDEVYESISKLDIVGIILHRFLN